MKKVLALTLALVMVVGLVGCSQPAPAQEPAATTEETPAAEAPAEKVAVTIAHNNTETHPWNIGAEAAKAYLEEASNGKFECTIYPNGSLFQSNWEILLEMLQTNSIQVGVEAMTALAAVNPDVNFLSLPFLFENGDQVLEFLNSDNAEWKAILDSFEDVGIVILGAAPRAFRQISNNKHEVATMEDMSDLTLRSPTNNLVVATMNALGINGVPMPSGEIYSAIQLGTVDGEDNSIGQQYDTKTFEVIKYFCICNYVADGQVMFCSKQFYDACSAEEQEMLHQMGQEFVKACYGEDSGYQVYAREEGEKMGVVFTEMSAEEQARCKEACAPVYAEYEKQYDPAVWTSLMAEVDAIKAK